MNHKQVAVLVPTTLLAQQHYENFKDRFANLPVNVEVLSRFKTAKEQKQILENLAEGKVDILIGTHKLIQSDVKFSDLGLLIIDEEHRFGVGQKEKIKQLRANIDIFNADCNTNSSYFEYGDEWYSRSFYYCDATGSPNEYQNICSPER